MMHAPVRFSRLYKLLRESPTFLLAAWFFALLLAGTVLLYLPLSHKAGGPPVSFLAALFTATSAFCVTGLTVVETHDAFSFFGQAVILLLIELGGVGIMTFASLSFRMIGRRMSMATQAALTDSLFQNDSALEFRTIFGSLLRAVLVIQLGGVVLLFLALHPWDMVGADEVASALWSALFHSVSAFCNAGFSTYYGNLMAVADNLPFLAVIAFLVILGGLGHGVLAELYRLSRHFRKIEKRPRWLSLNSRVSLTMTILLLVAGAAAVCFADSVFGGASARDLVNSVFHSIVARTAGFNSSDLGPISLPSCLFLCLLMFVGGCPGSCAGGVKTTSLAIWIARIGSNLRHDSNVNIFGYTVAQSLVSKARIIMALTTLWVVVGVVLLSMTQPGAGFDRLLFEQISALATVGLSMALTPELTDLSQLWIILSMIMGKFGPLTIALWMVPQSKITVGRPIGRLMIG